MLWIIFMIVVIALCAATLLESDRNADRRFWKDLNKKIEEARNDFA